jgi:hypothetical protein
VSKMEKESRDFALLRGRERGDPVFDFFDAHVGRICRGSVQSKSVLPEPRQVRWLLAAVFGSGKTPILHQ